jgi:hypothetical protein
LVAEARVAADQEEEAPAATEVIVRKEERKRSINIRKASIFTNLTNISTIVMNINTRDQEVDHEYFYI